MKPIHLNRRAGAEEQEPGDKAAEGHHGREHHQRHHKVHGVP